MQMDTLTQGLRANKIHLFDLKLENLLLRIRTNLILLI
jgi:hypothetical protein